MVSDANRSKDSLSKLRSKGEDFDPLETSHQDRRELRSFAQADPSEHRPLLQARLRSPITARQIECLYWVLKGKSANDIGGILGISGRTVEEHLLKACNHLGVRSRHQAAWRAKELGLLPSLDP